MKNTYSIGLAKSAFLIIYMLLGLSAFAQITLNVTSIPANTPMDEAIYVAGSFNGWDPGAIDYQLTEDINGNFIITIDPDPGLLEFKFTRGSWPTVEGNEIGGYLPNRTYDYDGSEQVLNLEILSWEGNGPTSTAADNVSILDEDFYMPQLGRNRRVWIYLPPDYDSSNKSYPVLYMHDGQNVFDAATSFSGEWEVDESLNMLFENGDEGIIVVAIDNGANHRLDEYSPWVNPQYGGGEGAEYVDFIVATLKPYIDEHFRTRPERLSTGIMGSSMGGLISLYAAIEHQDVFSKAGVFSASFWFSDECYTHLSSTAKQDDMKIYMIAGALEGSNGEQVTDMNSMYNTLLAAGFTSEEVLAIDHSDGQHSEWYWAREFPDAYIWLFGDVSTGEKNEKKIKRIKIYPNPGGEEIYLELPHSSLGWKYKIQSLDGREMMSGSLPAEKNINISQLPMATYLINIYQDGKLVYNQQFSKLN
ncbi:MAG: T9SS type A sorting domain-containing protein [Chitinophagales bacterium]|nr:T9SS type A sorting domain-containing protein [Chitinophagales bacterium]